MQISYKRVLLKLSGEALAGINHKFGIDPVLIKKLVSDIAALVNLKVQVGLVIGGGNFFRGEALVNEYDLVERVTGDQMGMLATIINSLVFRDMLLKSGIDAVVMSAWQITGVVENYEHRTAMQYLGNNKVVIFAAGTGNPLVSTDSAASLRAIEIKADVLLKATQVDGIYPSDPKKAEHVCCYKSISYNEILRQQLAVMDLSAIMQARDHNLKTIVFNINKTDALLNVIYGKAEGTIVTND